MKINICKVDYFIRKVDFWRYLRSKFGFGKNRNVKLIGMNIDFWTKSKRWIRFIWKSIFVINQKGVNFTYIKTIFVLSLKNCKFDLYENQFLDLVKICKFDFYENQFLDLQHFVNSIFGLSQKFVNSILHEYRFLDLVKIL